MMTLIENTFEEIMTARGYNAWYECDDEWESIEEEMVSMGLDENEVRAFFQEMEEDL